MTVSSAFRRTPSGLFSHPQPVPMSPPVVFEPSIMIISTGCISGYFQPLPALRYPGNPIPVSPVHGALGQGRSTLPANHHLVASPTLRPRLGEAIDLC